MATMNKPAYQGLFNPVIGTLKQQSNGATHIDAVIGTLAIDGWAVTFGTVRRGLGRHWPHPIPSLLYKM